MHAKVKSVAMAAFGALFLPEKGNLKSILTQGAERAHDDRSRAYRLRSIWR